LKSEISVFKRIRENCLGCSGGSPKEAKYCTSTDCELWPVRFGCKQKAAIRRLGKDGQALLDPSNFIDGGKFSPDKSVTEMEG
jgi:hypothetical protein